MGPGLIRSESEHLEPHVTFLQEHPLRLADMLCA